MTLANQQTQNPGILTKTKQQNNNLNVYNDV